MTAMSAFTRQNNALGFAQHAMRRTNAVKVWPMGAAGTVLNHPWKFTQDGDTGGTIAEGAVYIGGVLRELTDFPEDGELTDVTDTTLYWVEIDYKNATATFGSGAALPENTSTVEYWHVLTLTCADDVITAVYNPWPSDIRALLNP